MPFGHVRGVRGDLVGDHTCLDTDGGPKAEVLLARDVTEHRGAALGDLGCADGRGDVVVAGRDVGGEEAERRGLSFPQIAR